jgi:hypothetical protein
MAPPDTQVQLTYQAYFERRWGGLRHPRVRALAWLLDSPNLLDAADPGWHGQVMTQVPVTADVERWLFALDHDPSALNTAMGERVFTRLGLYAEKLMAFYFQEQGRLVKHGLQIRANRNDTVGEFDFLLDCGPDALEHIEFATKFYLLRPADPDDLANLDTLVGPNLADSLGAKMRKIMERQLVLGQHPAALALLDRPVVRAQALVKGWLFYAHDSVAAEARPGITPAHCRGFWCPIDAMDALIDSPDLGYLMLPKMQWLAPYRATNDAGVLTRAGLHAALSAQFETSGSPVLVAVVRQQPGYVVEVDRGFIVPAQWRDKALMLR